MSLFGYAWEYARARVFAFNFKEALTTGTTGAETIARALPPPLPPEVDRENIRLGLALYKSMSFQEPWHNVGASGEPGFQNSWLNYGSGCRDCRFRRNALGEIEIEGLVKSGSTATIFTLPPAFCPDAAVDFPVVANAGLARVQVVPNGNVNLIAYIASGTNAFVSLNLRFY